VFVCLSVLKQISWRGGGRGGFDGLRNTAFHIQDFLKRGIFCFNFAFEYASRKVQPEG
jgi:hypothetical protein